MKLDFHIKLLIALLAGFAVVIGIFIFYEPVKVKILAWQLQSADKSTREDAVNELLKCGERGNKILIYYFQTRYPVAEVDERIKIVETMCAMGDDAKAVLKTMFIARCRKEMVPIPAGEFMMGSEKGHDNEKPVHMVVVLFSFMMDKYEITNEKYFTYECLNERCKDYNSWAGANHFRANPSCPVNELNWNDAKGYSYFLCMKLPSEAQWEYACRAGTTTEYYFGDNNDTLPEYSWYWANYKYDETQVVGKKKPNNWGLYDMYGNVWEWCNDWYSETFYSESPSINPQGPSTGSWHVVRGGGWISDTEECRSASRNYNSFSLRYGGGGFRLISPSGK